ncbi:hypothetical protein ACFU9F_19205 [Streptomyces zhihengii]|uniref:hypothetical protein n=1 Tax=Streptomyces zhihengii TaxID=1818004 RepID=UPI0036B10061
MRLRPARLPARLLHALLDGLRRLLPDRPPRGPRPGEARPRSAGPVPGAPPPSGPPPRPVPHTAPLRGEDSALVRPYLVAHEREQENRRQRARRLELWLALYGVEFGPRVIHGVEVTA